MSRTVAVDFETYYSSADGVSIKTMGQRSYVRDPRCIPYLISVYDGTQAWAGHPRDFNFDALSGATLLSHNRAFDELVYQVNVERGIFPTVQYKDWHCTANLTTYLSMRRDLLRAAEFLLGETVDKSYRLDADGKSWEEMIKEGTSEKVKAAGRVDAVRCFQFFAKFGSLWPQMERDVSDLTIRQCRRGCQIDVPKLEKFLLVAQQMLIQAELDLPWMAAGRKPTSPKAVAEECRKVGIPAPPVKSRDGEDVYDKWASTYQRYPWVKAYTDYRVINKFIGTLETIKERLDAGGTFSYEMLYFGAHTGRFSGSGGFNVQNMRKDPLYCDDKGRLITDLDQLREIAAAKALPGYVAHVLDIRALFIARPGKKMIISDLSQIEPRALAWLVGDVVMLDNLRRGLGPYESHARATMGWTGGEMKKENKELYALAKARVLGLGYGCGWRKFIAVAQVMAGLDITTTDPEFEPVLNEDGEQTYDNKNGVLVPKMQSGYGKRSREIVSDYRASNPLVTGFWKNLDDAFKGSIGGDFSVTLPSGRQLRYPSVQRERKAVADPDKPGKWIHKWATTALAFDQRRNSVVRQPFYGGLIAENICQAFARDVFVSHLLELDKTSGIDVLFHVHDESVNEVDEHITARDVEQTMSKCPSWCEGLPVAAEAQEVDCYKK